MQSIEEQFLEGIYHPFPEEEQEAEEQNEEFKEEYEEQEELHVENEESAPPKTQSKGTVPVCACVNVHRFT